MPLEHSFPEFSSTFLQFWQAILMAQSQRCVYESVACAPRPRHLLLAKLAAAAVPLFGEMESIVRRDDEESSAHNASPILSMLAPTLTNHWGDFCRAWGMYMSCKAEHHQAMISQSKSQWGQELARLDLAYRFATLCLEYCERAPLMALQQLHQSVDATVHELRQRMEQAEHENAETHHQPVPHRQELTEIRGQTLVNIDQPLEKILHPLRGTVFFEHFPPPSGEPSQAQKAAGGHYSSSNSGSSSARHPQQSSSSQHQHQQQPPPQSHAAVAQVARHPQQSSSSQQQPPPQQSQSHAAAAMMGGGRAAAAALPRSSYNNNQNDNRNSIQSSNSNSNNNSSAASSIGVYVEMFQNEMDKLVFQMASVAEERTESARKALATVQLPHSLTAYRQEQSGGGIPDDLWERVEALQRERRISQLKQDLWELRDMAEVARSTYQRMEHQLDLDLEGDHLFRQDQPGFEGHDAKEVQKSFRQSLGNYDRLLVTAQEGDSVLLRRLEVLDTNPKYKLLQFQKSQLDRLLPGNNSNSNNGPNSNNPTSSSIDTSYLSRLLVELSALFHEREVLLNTIKEELQKYDIPETLQSQAPGGSDAEYRDALIYAQKSFDGIVYEMQTNIEKQSELVNIILAENEQFMMARHQGCNSSTYTSSADSCIAMIEDAIDELEQLTKHLKEGKDFYDVVIPKLDKLKQQIGDVSARLTVERLEYDDNANRSKQEEEDARMAKKLSSPDPSGGASGGGSRSNNNNNHSSRSNNTNGQNRHHQHQPISSRGQPGFTQVNNDEPEIFVDDEKVATLIAMEFDPTKVVAALMKYNNNVDQALNDLLSC
jgi:hypothetical protein